MKESELACKGYRRMWDFLSAIVFVRVVSGVWWSVGGSLVYPPDFCWVLSIETDDDRVASLQRWVGEQVQAAVGSTFVVSDASPVCFQDWTFARVTKANTQLTEDLETVNCPQRSWGYSQKVWRICWETLHPNDQEAQPADSLVNSPLTGAEFTRAVEWLHMEICLIEDFNYRWSESRFGCSSVLLMRHKHLT